MAGEEKPFIVRFYGSEKAEDAEGRTLDEILRFNHGALEYHHDYIQVLFPLPERSPINPDAPIITKAVRDAFSENDELQERLYAACSRMADFYAFELCGSKEDPTFELKRGFKALARDSWLTRMDHNHLRITRIIRCLRILGLEKVAQAFYDVLREQGDGHVSQRSLLYWERAAKRSLHLPPDESNEDAKGIAWLKERNEPRAQ